MGTEDMGELTDVNLREVWKHEALAFTPWLAKNLDKLSSVLDVTLELEEEEMLVGNLRADIVCRVPTDGTRVLIENQLEWANLQHLGQVMAYLAGLEARTVVWVARDFDEAHLSAFRWLNEHTSGEFGFFAVRLRAVKIGDSPPAPLFEVIERPNDWDRGVRTVGELSELGKLKRDFWARYRDRHPDVQRPTPGYAGSNVNDPISQLDARVSLYPAVDGAGIFISSSFGKPSSGLLERLDPYLEHLRSELEKAIAKDGLGHIYGPKHNSKLDIDGYDRANWDQIADWLESRRRIYMRVLTGPPGDDAASESDQ
ncbi:MAG: hypothetical protein OXG55_08015 [bacterium]|nr:hypothetical protein [bacterium]